MTSCSTITINISTTTVIWFTCFSNDLLFFQCVHLAIPQRDLTSSLVFCIFSYRNSNIVRHFTNDTFVSFLECDQNFVIFHIVILYHPPPPLVFWNPNTTGLAHASQSGASVEVLCRLGLNLREVLMFVERPCFLRDVRCVVFWVFSLSVLKKRETDLAAFDSQWFRKKSPPPKTSPSHFTSSNSMRNDLETENWL